MNETRDANRRIIARELQIRDLGKLRKLIVENLRVEDHKVPVYLIHFIFDLPLRSLGLGTIFCSIAQTYDEKIVGAIIARRFPLAKVWVIGPVVVDKRYRGFGIGNSIMELTLKSLQDKKAEGALISVDNTRRHSAARSFFRKFGFRYSKHIFTSSKQAYGYARMVTLRKSLYSRTRENSSQETDPEISQKTWYLMVKEF